MVHNIEQPHATNNCNIFIDCEEMGKNVLFFQKIVGCRGQRRFSLGQARGSGNIFQLRIVSFSLWQLKKCLAHNLTHKKVTYLPK